MSINADAYSHCVQPLLYRLPIYLGNVQNLVLILCHYASSFNSLYHISPVFDRHIFICLYHFCTALLSLDLTYRLTRQHF